MPRSTIISISNVISTAAKPSKKTALPRWPNGANWRREIRIIWQFGDWFALPDTTTAREANVRDFRVFFLTDGTATFGIGDLTADDIQAATCATLGFAFAQLATVDEMIARLENAATTSTAAE